MVLMLLTIWNPAELAECGRRFQAGASVAVCTEAAATLRANCACVVVDGSDGSGPSNVSAETLPAAAAAYGQFRCAAAADADGHDDRFPDQLALARQRRDTLNRLVPQDISLLSRHVCECAFASRNGGHFVASGTAQACAAPHRFRPRRFLPRRTRRRPRPAGQAPR
jgi:hypothetical protein